MGNIILMAEKVKGAVDEEAEVYEFEGMDDLIQFALVEANHFKQFKKLVNQYQDR
ncbi:hypothetical protein HP160_004370 [Salmonella enterica]|nr:hypothetical protein [Salmonella enterica]